jgi:hypothetical protein
MKNDLQKQIQKYKKKIALRESKGLESPNAARKLQELQGEKRGGGQPAAPVIPGQDPQVQNQIDQGVQNNELGFTQNSGYANQYMGNVFNQLQNQGQFNPQGLPSLNQDFTQQRQQATDSVMNEFNRLNKDRFAYEDTQFEQQMAEQGIDPTSEKYQTLKKQNDLSRGSQVQQAQNNAFQMGQSEQAQGFGQSLSANNQMFNQQYNQYQMPLQQLGAMNPFYQQQGNMMQYQQGLDFQGQQSQLGRQHDFDLAKQNQQYALQQIKATPRGGGGGGGGQPPIWAQYGFSSPLEYDQYKFNQQMLLNGGGGLGQQQQQPNMGNAAVSGFANGAGAAIGSTLLR